MRAARRRRRRRFFARASALLVPFLLSLALAAACLYGSAQSARAEGLQNNVEELYRQAFYELADNVNDMQVALKKLMVVASSQQHVLLLGDISRLSSAAAANLAALPQSHLDTLALNRFVIQTGDYAHSLSRRILDGAFLTAADTEQLYQLFEAGAAIARHLEDRLAAGDLPVTTLTGEDYFSSADPDAYESIDSIAH